MRMRSQPVIGSELVSKEAFYAPPGQVFLTPGKEYTVYAVSVYDSVVFVQVVDDKYTPVFLPRGLFEVIDASVPNDWICTVLAEGSVQLILGPEHVARDLDAYNGMVDQDASQVERFWHRIDTCIMPKQ